MVPQVKNCWSRQYKWPSCLALFSQDQEVMFSIVEWVCGKDSPSQLAACLDASDDPLGSLSVGW